MSAFFYILSGLSGVFAYLIYGPAMRDQVASCALGLGALTLLAVAATLGELRTIRARLERMERNLWNVNLAQLEVLKHPEKDTPTPKFSEE